MRLLRLYALSDAVKDRLWKQLDTAYFLRHDAQEIAWQTRTLHYRVDADKPVVKARLAPFGEGLQVMIYMPRTAKRCSRASAATSSAPASTSSRPRSTPRATATRSTPSWCMGKGADAHYRDMIEPIEAELPASSTRRRRSIRRAAARLSRRVRHFPSRRWWTSAPTSAARTIF